MEWHLRNNTSDETVIEKTASSYSPKGGVKRGRGEWEKKVFKLHVGQHLPKQRRTKRGKKNKKKKHRKSWTGMSPILTEAKAQKIKVGGKMDNGVSTKKKAQTKRS